MPRLSGFAPIPLRGPAPLPLLGTPAAVLRFFADPVGRVLALHREFGEVAALLDRSPAFVCAFGAERNREVLSNAESFQHSPELPIKVPAGSAFERLSHALILMNGEAHRRHRSLMAPAFNKASLDGYAPLIAAVTDTMLQRWPVGRVADVSKLVRELTLCVAVRCLFGLDVSEGAEELGRLWSRHLDLMTSPLNLALPLPIPGMPYHALLRVAEQLVAKLLGLIEERRRQPAGRHDALSMMIRAHDADGSRFTDDELIGEANTLFVAGHETMTNTLAWTLFLLAQHPEVLNALLDELDGVLRGAPPTLEHLPRLLLLDRVVKESMRLLPATPILFIRVCAREVPLGPYVLPEGANVILSPLVTHRDPERFPDPNRFRPERWEQLEPTPYEYLPFGRGPRMCLGANFATMGLRLMLPAILQRYRLSLVPGALVSRRVRGITFGFRRGLPMHVAPPGRPAARREEVRGDVHELVELS